MTKYLSDIALMEGKGLDRTTMDEMKREYAIEAHRILRNFSKPILKLPYTLVKIWFEGVMKAPGVLDEISEEGISGYVRKGGNYF